MPANAPKPVVEKFACFVCSSPLHIAYHGRASCPCGMKYVYEERIRIDQRCAAFKKMASFYAKSHAS